MTDVLERPRTRRPRVSSRKATNPDCRSHLHLSLTAGRFNGCICPEALAARAAYNAGRRMPGKTCTAGRHDTITAYRDDGCTCPDARTAWRRYREGRWRQADRMRNGHDPRAQWRGPHTRVDRWRMLLFSLGVVDLETDREVKVAVWRLEGTPNRYGTGIIDYGEIAERLGIDRATAYQYATRTRRALRDQRTARRLADAKWRAWHKHGMRW